MDEAMSPCEFKYAIRRLSDGSMLENVMARKIAAAYIDADETTRRDLSRMFRADHLPELFGRDKDL